MHLIIVQLSTEFWFYSSNRFRIAQNDYYSLISLMLVGSAHAHFFCFLNPIVIQAAYVSHNSTINKEIWTY